MLPPPSPLSPTPALFNRAMSGRAVGSAAVLLCSIVVGTLGIDGWYARQARQIESQTAAYAEWASDQRLVTTEFGVIAPADTPPGQTLYLSGSAPGMGGWHPAGLRLERRSDGKYYGSVESMSGVEHSFRLTRGTAATAECGPEGETLPCRTLAPQASSTLEIRVARWADHGQTVASPLARF
jgi:hypothetical protein